ncbi:MAG: putative secreted glucosidase [Pseudonocardiales bacterium]|nr:putative secreted glucosidase [Pseudonocardiales bacterium]
MTSTQLRRIVGYAVVATLGIGFTAGVPAAAASTTPAIVIGAKAPDLEVYAARELQRYLAELTGTRPAIQTDNAPLSGPAFLIGVPSSNAYLAQLASNGSLAITAQDPGPQGYVLQNSTLSGQQVLAIAGSDSAGALNGVYGLLTDHYGMSFGLTGDVFPPSKQALQLVAVNERKTPAQKIRGVVPWDVYPQGSSSYSQQDLASIIDQMAKMRLNLLNLHNYTGTLARRQTDYPYANFKFNGIQSRPQQVNSQTGTEWGELGWNIDQYRFGAADLFDDNVYGSTTATHGVSLGIDDVFGKGRSLFQWVLRYAHSRGVMVALGIDLNTVPAGYPSFSTPGVAAARAAQIVSDYPTLDYFIGYRSEGMPSGQNTSWKATFTTFRTAFSSANLPTKTAVSGWGLLPEFMSDLPADVIAAPIAPYTASFDNGAGFGTREYWGTPWLENDNGSSLEYAPSGINLSATIASYQAAAPNMTGIQALTWRLGDAVDAKVMWLSEASWDSGTDVATAQGAYQHYATTRYGSACAPNITPIINQNEATGLKYAESSTVKPPTSTDRSADATKAKSQSATINACIASTADPSQRDRLQNLAARIDAAEASDELDQSFASSSSLATLGTVFGRWISDMDRRVNDIGSLGMIVSAENRFVQFWYSTKEHQLVAGDSVWPPTNVQARSTQSGADITWQDPNATVTSYQVYRDGILVGSSPTTRLEYADSVAAGTHKYTVVAVNGASQSQESVPDSVATGTALTDPPRVVVISPPSSESLGSPVDIEARILSDRAYSGLSATLHYRTSGLTTWTDLPMSNRVRGIFGARIPATSLTSSGLEYYVSASDGINRGTFPVAGTNGPASVVAFPASTSAPTAPTLSVVGRQLQWTAPAGAAGFRVYRSFDRIASAGPQTLLTTLGQSTTSFTDSGTTFAGAALAGRFSYRVSALDPLGREGQSSTAVDVDYGAGLNTQEAEQATIVGPYTGGDQTPYIYLTPGTSNAVAVNALGKSGSQILWRGLASGQSFTVSYINPTGSMIQASLVIDGIPVGKVKFPPSSGIGSVSVQRPVQSMIAIRFGDDDYGANGSTNQLTIDAVSVNGGPTKGFEGEDASLVGASRVSQATASGGVTVGYFGDVRGDSITWSGVPTVNHESIRYSNAFATTQQAGLYSGNTRVATVSFPPTGDWANYSEAHVSASVQGFVSLRADSVDVAANGGKWCCGVDRMTAIGVGQDDLGSEAESGTLAGGATVVSQPAASGSATVGYLGPHAGGSITWPALTAGTGISIAFANANSTATHAGLYSGGTRVATLSFAPTGSWDSYLSLDVPVEISGAVKIQVDPQDVTNNGANYCCAIDRVTLHQGTPGGEVEYARLTGGADFFDRFASGGVSVGAWTTDNDGVQLVGVRQGDAVSIRYANGSSYGLQATLEVTGEPNRTLTFTPTSSWTRYSLLTVYGAVAGTLSIVFTPADRSANAVYGVNDGVRLDRIDVH